MTAAPPAPERGRREALAFALVWLPYALLVWRFWFLCDDAFISFRFAKHWAAGDGVRFNPGEHVPVEGYSNFLWVALAAVCERLGPGAPAVMPWLSFAAGSALLGAVFLVLRRRLELPLHVAALATLALGCSPPFAVWSTSGLETMAFALLLFVVFERLVLRRAGIAPVSAGLAGAALALIRVEGVLWLPVLGALALAARTPADPRAWRSVARFLALALAGFGVWWLWRRWYYGQPLPNTLYAKVGLDAEGLAMGFDYVAAFCLTLLTPFGLLLTGPAVFARGRRAALLPVLAMALGVGAFALLAGGDFMTFGRFLVPSLPFQALLLGALLGELADRPRARHLVVPLAAAWVALGLLPAWNVHLVPASIRAAHHFRLNTSEKKTELEQWRRMRDNVARRRLEARALNRVVEPGQSLITPVIGTLGYETELFLLDLFGLVSSEVARLDPSAAERSPGHRKSVTRSFFLDRAPDYLMHKSFLSSELGSVEDLRRELRRTAGSWGGKPVGARYAPILVQEELPEQGGALYVLLMARVGLPAAREAAREAFEARLASL